LHVICSHPVFIPPVFSHLRHILDVIRIHAETRLDFGWASAMYSVEM
jgi:hypothetical protein